MYIEQMYTNCLAEAAYYIESDGEAAVIDPIRETSPYLEKAKARGVKIKYVFETHFHADFVSGHIDLARASGAEIVFGPGAETAYAVRHAVNGEELRVGKLRIKVLHTPGHTPESTCYLLFNEEQKAHCVFTGDTLFVGDVGRPDLLDGKMTKEALAGMMYDSLNTYIKPLADDVIVYPAHGPGSSCGKNIGKETWSTIGQQKKSNYALQEMSKSDFVSILTEGLVPPPGYFFKDAKINKEGYENIGEVMKKNLRDLDVKHFQEEVRKGALILDTRNADLFEKGFIPGALNIGLNGSFAIWVGTLVDINRNLVLITEAGKEEETVRRLARVGYENVSGYMKGGIEAWVNAGNKTESVQSITPAEFKILLEQKKGTIIDVRNAGEFDSCHVPGATLLPLSEFENKISALKPGEHYFVHCAGGYRSMIASSILKKHGIQNFSNVLGGMGKIREAGVAVEEGHLH
jgi:hydroxyacylglutathione hydrolase